MPLRDIAIVTIVSVTLLAALRFRKPELPPVIVAGSVISSVGFGCNVAAAFRNSLTFPHLGHVLFGLGLLVLVIGIAQVPGNHRTYVGPLMLFDTVMVASAWVLMLSALAVSRPGHHTLAEANWPVLSVIVMEALAATLAALLCANWPQAGMAALATGEWLLVFSNTFAAHSVVFGIPAPAGVRATLMAASTVLVSVGLLTMSPAVVDRDTTTQVAIERNRTVFTMCLLAVPLVIVISLTTVGRGMNDQANAMFGMFVVGAYGGREFVRSRQNRRVLQLLSDQALHDPLTGLGNRRALIEALTRVSAQRQPVSVVSMDLDRFKEVNRQLGHNAGDQVLIAIANLLRDHCVGEIFRLGGDEFAIITPLTQSSAVVGADELRRGVPLMLAQLPGIEALAVTLSVGIARYTPTEDDQDPLEVLSRSTQALRIAKIERNRVRVYSDADAAQLEYRSGIERRLRYAVAKGHVTFSYQPIVRIADGSISALESLARWTDSEIGHVSPAEFIPIAEQTGLIHDLGRSALEAAARVVASLHEQGHQVSVSVNVSPVQLRRSTFDHELNSILQAHAVAPSWITLEVTEGIFMDLDDPAVLTLYRLAAQGVTIAIDDFGSGYSSLGYMTRLPAHVVKVDRVLTQRISRPKARSVIQALVWVAQSHNLRLIAEGVETDDERRELESLGAEYGQGWLWSRGVPEADVPALFVPRQINRRRGDAAGGQVRPTAC